MLSLETKAKIASIAYSTNRELIGGSMKAWLPGGEIRFLYIEKTDTEAHIYKYGGDNCIIAFAGTESFKDLKYDLFFFPKRYKKGYVHSGFLKIVNQVKDEMNKILSEMFPNGIKQLDIVGHSLGGAISILAIDEIKTHYYKGEVTTFGCPNGFSKKARKYLESKYEFHNVINYCDFVTVLLGFTSGRPETTRTNLGFKWGHNIIKYIKGIVKNENFY